MTSPARQPAIEPSEIELAVRQRYSKAARKKEPTLCCPVQYDASYLAVIPDAVLARDYGCGDPSRWVREGDSVLDLGSGGGKICFIAAQIVGPKGRVIGFDTNEEMLSLARRAAPIVAGCLGYTNVEFRRGRIQDLRLDLDALDAWLRANPIRGATDLAILDQEGERLRRVSPLVPDGSVDIVVSNCVLNLVRPSDKAKMFREIYRALKPCGRIAISDIVSDRPVPQRLRDDPALWSGCVSGALEEGELLRQLRDVGFQGIRIAKWEDDPFAVVEDIEFRSVTVTARRGETGPCGEENRWMIYRGPWRGVEDDDGHVFNRGERMAVSEKTEHMLAAEAYRSDIIVVDRRGSVQKGCC